MKKLLAHISAILLLSITAYPQVRDMSFSSDPAREIAGLNEKLLRNPEDTEAIKRLILTHSYLRNNHEIIKLGKDLIELGLKKDDVESYLYGLTSSGVGYQGLSMPDSMFYYYDRALELSLKNDAKWCLIMVYNGLGVYYVEVETDYYKALEYFLEGMKFAEDDSDPKIYPLLCNIAATYYLREDPAGLEYALEVYELGKKHNNNYLIYIGSNVSAGMYYILQDYEKALQYIKVTESLVESFGEKTGVFNLYANILLAMGEEHEAVRYYQRALQYVEEGKASFVIEAYMNYGQYLMEKGRWNQAIEYLEKGIGVSRERHNTINLYLLYKCLSECYEKTGHIETALRYYRMYHEQNDSIYNYHKEKSLDELRVQYETEKKEREIQEKKVELLKEQKKAQVSLLILAIILIGIGVAYVLYRKQNRMYKQIVRQHHDMVRMGRVFEDKKAQRNSSATGDKYSVSSLSEERGGKMFRELENLMASEKLYRDKDITIEKLAERLGTNRTYVSQIINEQTGSSFNNYINSYRINEAVKALSDPANDIQLKTLAYELGFNYRETFYKSFQKAIGMSPSKYREEIARMYGKHS